MKYLEKLKRYQEITKMVEMKISTNKIGKRFDITHQRVCQIIKSGPPKERELKRHFGDVPKWLTKGRDRTRELVRIRDKHTCQNCKKVWVLGMRRFDVHHLNGLCGKKSLAYDSVNELGSMITLCHKCHFNHPEHSQYKKRQEKLSTVSTC